MTEIPIVALCFLTAFATLGFLGVAVKVMDGLLWLQDFLMERKRFYERANKED